MNDQSQMMNQSKMANESQMMRIGKLLPSTMGQPQQSIAAPGDVEPRGGGYRMWPLLQVDQVKFQNLNMKPYGLPSSSLKPMGSKNNKNWKGNKGNEKWHNNNRSWAELVVSSTTPARCRI
ncbi:hypothetical protein L2E82_08964 [Cichorium intybus]|uniref:Uncharacterized protein n=1 Tax=Cichorium intybus TaxID=13427 RepID=A0ACB9G7A0_CICIN|nr:hypothetical protein L2E82_08964 [Cichorium intybus]